MRDTDLAGKIVKVLQDARVYFNEGFLAPAHIAEAIVRAELRATLEEKAAAEAELTRLRARINEMAASKSDAVRHWATVLSESLRASHAAPSVPASVRADANLTKLLDLYGTYPATERVAGFLRHYAMMLRAGSQWDIRETIARACESAANLLIEAGHAAPAPPAGKDQEMSREPSAVALRLLLCENCVNEHVRNTQSVSCYCVCHSSASDKQDWQTNRDTILTQLAAHNAKDVD